MSETHRLLGKIAVVLIVGLWLSSPAAAQVAAPPALGAPCDCTTLPTLGSASKFAAMNTSDRVFLNGAAFAQGSNIAGNIAVGPGGSAEFGGAAGTDGFVDHHTGTVVTNPGAALGGVTEKDMSTEVADLIAASTAYAAMPPTQTFGTLTASTTLTGNGCINVVQLNGDIDLNGNDKVRFQGTSEDYFVINITGDFSTSGNAALILDGMNPSHVIYNFVTPGSVVDLQGNGTANGTYLNPFGEIEVEGTAGGTGAYYAGVNTLLFQGDADFYAEPFGCEGAQCADPESSGINIQTPSTPPSRGTGSRSFFYAYADPATFEGHLESFRVAPDGTIKDQLDNDAIDSVTNELKPGRTPYWDAGAELMTNISRTLYTTDAGAREPLDNTIVDEIDLNLQVGEIPSYPNFPASGVTTLPLLRDAILAYVRGEDAFDADGDLDFGELRSFVLGDIFRSNPVIIGSPRTVLSHEPGYANFATTYYQRDRVVYAGANDGLLHAFDAGTWWDPDDPDPLVFNSGTGGELFGYAPGLLVDQLKLTPRTDDLTGKRLAPGFVDGNIVAADAWIGDDAANKTSDEWATVMISAFREGGRGYLAMDVTDPAAGPAADHGPYPKLLWEFTDADLGQSWSRPVIARVKLAGAPASGDQCGADDGDVDCREQWVAIFGGGYEPESDPNDLHNYIDDPTKLGWSDRTKAIFMVALDTGQVVASVTFDPAGVDGPSEMTYAVASAPAALDLDGDGYVDVIYIGDLGGQLWKWDVSKRGVDSDADPLIDNWDYGIFFEAPPVVLSSGRTHYKSMYNPPSAAFVSDRLTLAFGTGERNDVLYEGDPGADDENRYYVVRDHPDPLGLNWFLDPALNEGNLLDVTATGVYIEAGDEGYFFKGVEGEKFITDTLIFAGYAIFGSYEPPIFPVCGPGKANLFIFDLGDAKGFFDNDATFTASDRHIQIGWGIPSNPRVSVARDPGDDKIFINTSDGQVLSITPPVRDVPESSTIYWKQKF